MIGFIILLIIIVVIVVYFVGIYNGLVTARNGYKNAFAQIDVQLHAALRPDPEPGRNRQRLHGARARNARSGDRARNAAVSGLAAAKANRAIPRRCSSCRAARTS